MTTYNPDKWMLVKLTNNEGKFHHRVFAVWSGSYTTGDSWKLNSGITKILEDEDFYKFEGSSGSVYHCRKGMYGSTGYGHSVIRNIVEESKDIGLVIEILEDPENIFDIVLEN